MNLSPIPVHKETVKLKKRRFLKFKAPFLDDLSGLGTIKLIGLDANVTFQ